MIEFASLRGLGPVFGLVVLGLELSMPIAPVLSPVFVAILLALVYYVVECRPTDRTNETGE